jgi:hypothetical protein
MVPTIPSCVMTSKSSSLLMSFATAVYRQAQQAYLEAADENAREEFFHLLRGQRQRLVFVMPDGSA